MPQSKSVGQKCFDVAHNSGPVCKKTVRRSRRDDRGTQYLPKDLSNKQGLFSLGKSGEAFARRGLQSIMPLGEMKQSLPNL